MNRGLPQWLVSVIIMSSCAALSLIMLAINRFIRFFQMRSAGAFQCPQTIKKEVAPAATARFFALVGLDTPPSWAGCDLGCMRLFILDPCTNATSTLKPLLNGQYGRMACANKPGPALATRTWDLSFAGPLCMLRCVDRQAAAGVLIEWTGFCRERGKRERGAAARAAGAAHRRR